MNIALRKPSDIRPENNPRLIDAAVDTVATSLREFGFREPIVVEDEGVIMVNHTCHMAALASIGKFSHPSHMTKSRGTRQWFLPRA